MIPKPQNKKRRMKMDTLSIFSVLFIISRGSGIIALGRQKQGMEKGHGP
jgi:hypothetical protein